MNEHLYEGKKLLLKYGWILLLMVVIFASVWYRAYPLYLPVTDDWAEDTVTSQVKSQIMEQVKSTYPNLPAQNLRELADVEFSKLDKKQFEAQVEGTSNFFKSEFQDSTGQTYLLAIDPWLWYGYARNYVDNGHWGDEYRDGKSWYSLRRGRDGQQARFAMFPFLTVVNYKVMNLWNETSVMKAAFFLPFVLIGLASVLWFFVGRKIGGNLTGVVAGVIVGIHSALLNRTVAGFSDTDNIIALGEVITVAFLIFALSEKEEWKRWVYVVMSGFFMAAYASGHPSWWHMFDFMLGALVVWFAYLVWIHRREYSALIEKCSVAVQVIVTFVVSTWVSYPVLRFFQGQDFWKSAMSIIVTPVTGALAFLKMKDVGIGSIWPNVMTTVAELNKVSVPTIINHLGGKFLFILSVIGILCLLFRKVDGERKYVFHGALLALWYVGAIYASTTSLRFIALLVPAFALAMASLVAFLYYDFSRMLEGWINVKSFVSKGVVVVMLIVLVLMPMMASADAVARSEVPNVNDDWYEALRKINADSGDAIITSWWDFGHHFVAIAERRVTFDGGDQGERIHWVGRVLLESNESQAVGILRMLNCGQEKAPHSLSNLLGGGLENDVKAIQILDEVFSLNREEARVVYEGYGVDADKMLELTHCDDVIPQYFITSQDMVGKAGVWGHFGSWDFERAYMFNQVKGSSFKVPILEQFNISDEEYYDIQGASGDEWIAPWPVYASGVRDGVIEGNNFTCSQGLSGQPIDFLVDLRDMNTTVLTNPVFKPDSVVFPVENGTDEIFFDDDRSKLGVSLVLLPKPEGFKCLLASPRLGNSIFTRLFFMDGYGLESFDLFDDRRDVTGHRIITWKVKL